MFSGDALVIHIYMYILHNEEIVEKCLTMKWLFISNFSVLNTLGAIPCELRLTWIIHIIGYIRLITIQYALIYIN